MDQGLVPAASRRQELGGSNWQIRQKEPQKEVLTLSTELRTDYAIH